MSVVNIDYDDVYNAEAKHTCSACGGKLYAPFVHWHPSGTAAVGILICGKCCIKVKAGLTADIIQCAAATEIMRLRADYVGFRLVREHQTRLHQLAQKQVEFNRKIERLMK